MINEFTMADKQTQHKRILEYLKTGKVLTPLQALGVAGTMKLATRIGELIREGYPIVKEWYVTPSGKRVMSYRMEVEERKPFGERIKTFFDDLLSGGMFESKRV